MSEVATRQDIDEAIGIVKDFMKHVDERFEYAEERFRNQPPRRKQRGMHVVR